MPGWGELFVEEVVDKCSGETTHVQLLDDASSSMFIVFLLFIFPSKLTFWPFTSWADARPSKSVTAHNVPVDANILSGLCWTGLMFRSGFLGESPSSLAADLLLLVTRFDEKDNIRFRFFPEASKRSGLSVWVGQELGVLGGLPDWAMVVIVCILVLQLKRKILQ